MKQTPATDIANRMTTMETSIAALERQVQEQARQITVLLAAVSLTPVEDGDELDAATILRIRRMAQETINYEMSSPPRQYKKRTK